MARPMSTATIGRTTVIGGFVLALALVGRPVGLAVLLGIVLLTVWAAPIVLTPPRHGSPAGPVNIRRKAEKA